MKNRFLTKKIAFTMAEVLITLGIIGIVAALTIPPLVSNYQKRAYVIKLQKAYASFNIALKQLTNDYGCGTDLACTGLFSDSASSSSFPIAIAKYLKISTDCTYSGGYGCFSKFNSNYDGSGSLTDLVDVYYTTFITVDGASYAIWGTTAPAIYADCKQSAYDGLGPSPMYTNSSCGYVYIDVNGPKQGPNYFGRDVFRFFITNQKGAYLYPSGAPEYKYWNSAFKYCSDQSLAIPKNGDSCAGRVLETGSMDY